MRLRGAFGEVTVATITGIKAIRYAVTRGATLRKFVDHTGPTRDLAFDEASRIAGENPTVVYVRVRAADLMRELHRVLGSSVELLHNGDNAARVSITRTFRPTYDIAQAIVVLCRFDDFYGATSHGKEELITALEAGNALIDW